MLSASSRKFSALDDNFNLSAEFNVSIEKIEKKYLKALTTKFKGCKRLKFSKVIEFSRPEFIEKGELCYQSFPDLLIKIYLNNQLKENKTRSIQVVTIKDSRVTSSYLIWYFSQSFVSEYISLFALGSVVAFIPNSAFNRLEIPIPKRNKFNSDISEINISIAKNPFRKLIEIYYSEYKDNFERQNYMSAAIMAGAIGESLVYSFLLEKNIDETLLERKTFGSLLEFVKILKVDETEEFPLNHFIELQQLRNDAVHPGKAKNNVQPEAEVEKPDFACFDNIVRYFGL